MSQENKALKKSQSVESLITTYGDFIYDLCVHCTDSEATAQNACRLIFREFSDKAFKEKWGYLERAQVLSRAVRILRKYKKQTNDILKKIDHSKLLDPKTGDEERLLFMKSYLSKLPFESQLILILRDKYGLSYSEISTLFAMNEDSVKLTRQQSLRILESDLWPSL